MVSAVFPGSFCPPTLAHAHVVERAARLCDTLYVLCAVNPEKASTYMFTLQEREAMLRHDIATIIQPRLKAQGITCNIVVATTEGFTPHFMLENDVSLCIRGLRNSGIEAEYPDLLLMIEEFKKAGKDMDIAYIPCVDPFLQRDVSSTAVRRLAAAGCSAQELFNTGMVSEFVAKATVERAREMVEKQHYIQGQAPQSPRSAFSTARSGSRPKPPRL